MRTIPVLALTLLVAACGGAPQAQDEVANRTATPVPTPTAPPAQASKVEAKTDDYSFAYAYPAQAAAIAPLRSWLDGERGEDPFNACPKVAEATLILGSTDRRTIDRLGLLVDPYVAGAYAEGRFDLTVPVTAEVIAALKPEFGDAFAAR